MSPVTAEPYERVATYAEPVDVDVIVKIRLSTRLQDAAAACHLSHEEYAQRMATLYARGQIGGLMVPADPPPSSWQNSPSDVLEIKQFSLMEI
jgi:hypothetical protein